MAKKNGNDNPIEVTLWDAANKLRGSVEPAAGYIQEIKQILAKARQKAYAAVNVAMVQAYWVVGKRIVAEEQNGKEIIRTLSDELNAEFGKGYSVTNLKNFRKFYLLFNDIEKGQTLSDFLNKPIQQTLSAKSDTKREIGQTVSGFSKDVIWQAAFAKLSCRILNA